MKVILSIFNDIAVGVQIPARVTVDGHGNGTGDQEPDRVFFV